MEVLYKYRFFSSRALEVLIKRQVYFAAADELNDPYDCRISIRQALSHAIQAAESSGNEALQNRLQKFRKIDHVYEKMEADVGAVGVLSLTTCPIEHGAIRSGNATAASGGHGVEPRAV